MPHVIPVAVQVWVISEGVKMLVIIGSEKVTVNLMGKLFAGSRDSHCVRAVITSI